MPSGSWPKIPQSMLCPHGCRRSLGASPSPPRSLAQHGHVKGQNRSKGVRENLRNRCKWVHERHTLHSGAVAMVCGFVTRLHVEHSTEEGGTIKGLERVGPQRGPATPLQTASPRWSPTCTIVAPRSGERVVVKMQMPVQPPVN